MNRSLLTHWFMTGSLGLRLIWQMSVPRSHLFRISFPLCKTVWNGRREALICENYLGHRGSHFHFMQALGGPPVKVRWPAGDVTEKPRRLEE